MLIKTKNIRNIAIIAHIDHGKTTLADRFLELTNFRNIKKENRKKINRVLDSLALEQEKGITIKSNVVQLLYYYPPNGSPGANKLYAINIVDTPGHVDLSTEVSRPLLICDGALVLIDATKGVQAQTLAYWEMARQQGLKIIFAINKIDLPHSQIEKVQNQLIELSNCSIEDICLISAKTGKNVDLLLERIVKEISPPKTI